MIPSERVSRTKAGCNKACALELIAVLTAGAHVAEALTTLDTNKL